MIAAIRNPAQLVVGAFVVFITMGTGLLWLPIATDGPGHIGLEDALFTSTSAATVTGLMSTDISRFSLFGEIVIMLLIQIGGFGIMTIGSVLAIVASRHVSLRQRMLARAEIGAVDMGDLRRLISAIARITLVVEAVVATILSVRFWQGGYEDGPLQAAYSGVFHAISSFNNAGISLYPDNLAQFVADPVVVLSVTFAFIVGGLGFPILVELGRRERQRRRGEVKLTAWSLHTKITLLATAGLLAFGPLVVMAFEWTNPLTLGPLDTFDKVLAGWFQGVTPRTAGFNTVDIGGMNEPTLLVITTLMFIGAGPASTSGGIKVTTFAVLQHRHERVPSSTSGQPDPPGPHGRAAVDRTRRRRIPRVDERRGLLALTGDVRGHVRVRNRGALDGHHWHGRAVRAPPARRRDARRSRRPHHVRDRACTARAESDVPLSRGATDHWLRRFINPCGRGSDLASSTGAKSSSSGWAGSVPPWPRR